MGSYIPTKRRRRKSLVETLDEAESDHYLDCPSADLKWRVGAAFLDFIFIFLMISAVNRVENLILHTSLGQQINQLSYEGRILLGAAKLMVEALAVFSVFFWPVVNYGGSPGKLLLGLKVVDVETGKLLSFPQVFLREILGKCLLGTASLLIGLILPIFRDDSRALQDLISRSVVKKVH